MCRWLAGFDDGIPLSPWFFVAASAMAVVIALATATSQVWRVASAEPAVPLRQE